MRARNGSLGWAIAAKAKNQHGNITRAQLLDLGLSSAAVGRRVVNGLLHPEYLGVYRVGHCAPSTLARYAAAVLACGDGAVLCGPAAAWLYGLLRRSRPAPEVITEANRRVRGVIVHRARQLAASDVRTWEGIPVLTIPRLIVDLAGALSLDLVAKIHHEAWIRFKVQPEAIEEVLERRPTAKGAAGLRAVIHGDTPVVLSRLERGFLVFVREHGFPMPLVNRPEGAHYIDCRYLGERVTIELDSFRFHNTRLIWEQDRQRDRDAHDRGDRLRRFTWHDVFVDQSHMLRQMNRLLPRK
jgi:hypothetical protein